MTDDEKLAERCLERRLRLTAGQARDLAEKDFDWIKSKGAKPAEDAGESGSHIGLSDAEFVQEMSNQEIIRKITGVADDHYTIETTTTWDRTDPDEIKRMSES